MKAIPDSADLDWFGTKPVREEHRPPFGKKRAAGVDPEDDDDEEEDDEDDEEEDDEDADEEYEDEADDGDEEEDDEEEALQVLLRARRERRREAVAREGKGHIHTDKWHRCVEHVKKRGGGYEPHAVCTSSIGYKGSINPGHRRRGRTKESDPLDLELQSIFRESERGLDPSTALFEAKSQPLFARTHQRGQAGKIWTGKKPRQKKQPLIRKTR